LGGDPILGATIWAEPGLRSPGHVDGFELAARAVLGQQVSVAGARTLASRLVAAHGEPLTTASGELTHFFPTAEQVASADPTTLSLTQARAASLIGLARAVADGDIDLDPGADRDRTAAQLLALPGIGPWTVSYIRMRALADPDVFMASDLGVRRGLQELGFTAGSAISTSSRRVGDHGGRTPSRTSGPRLVQPLPPPAVRPLLPPPPAVRHETYARRRAHERPDLLHCVAEPDR